jgi:hypothetical protein
VPQHMTVDHRTQNRSKGRSVLVATLFRGESRPLATIALLKHPKIQPVTVSI